jgi:hypothetical protein
MKDSAALVSTGSLAPPLCLQTCYISLEREIPIISTVVHEAANEKAHVASDQGPFSSGGKKLKCHNILHGLLFRRQAGLHWLLS